MSSYAYERLSAQDASFLWAEAENEPMHIGAVAVYETGPLQGEAGGLDIARYREAIEAVLHWIPRYRQKIRWTPLEGWPIWVDDRQFELGYHSPTRRDSSPSTSSTGLPGTIRSRWLEPGARIPW